MVLKSADNGVVGEVGGGTSIRSTDVPMERYQNSVLILVCLGWLSLGD